jgi:hypothetical protein
MIRQARQMARRRFERHQDCRCVNYLQNWLSEARPRTTNRPNGACGAQSDGGAIGDIGTNAYNLASYPDCAPRL